MLGKKSEIWPDRVLDGFAATVALAAIVLAASVVWENLTDSERIGRDREIDGWEAMASSGHRLGPPEAPVVIVEFIDYECPFCRRAEGILASLRKTYPEDLAVVVRHLPLRGHVDAYAAARLAECAADQGGFARMHSYLFSLADLSGLDPAVAAEAVEIPSFDIFLACANGIEAVPRIEADLAASIEFGIPGVPGIVVEGTLLGVTPDSATLFRIVAESINTKRNRGH